MTIKYFAGYCIYYILPNVRGYNTFYHEKNVEAETYKGSDVWYCEKEVVLFQNKRDAIKEIRKLSDAIKENRKSSNGGDIPWFVRGYSYETDNPENATVGWKTGKTAKPMPLFSEVADTAPEQII